MVQLTVLMTYDMLATEVTMRWNYVGPGRRLPVSHRNTRQRRAALRLVALYNSKALSHVLFVSAAQYHLCDEGRVWIIIPISQIRKSRL